MGDRGRTPAAELSVVKDLPDTRRRPKAPDSLTEEQKKVWKKTAEAMPVDWFRPETQDTLEQYCRHVVQGRVLDTMINEMLARPHPLEGCKPEEGVHFCLKEYSELLKLHKGESAQTNALARSLRITLQSTYDKGKKKGSAELRAWE